MYTPPNTLKWCMASESGFNSRNAFVYIRGRYSSKNIAKSRWSVHLRLGRHPKKQAFGTVFEVPPAAVVVAPLAVTVRRPPSLRLPLARSPWHRRA